MRLITSEYGIYIKEAHHIQEEARFLFTPSVATSEIIQSANINSAFLGPNETEYEEQIWQRHTIQVEALFTEVRV